MPGVDKYSELCKTGHSHICLFPSRKAYKEFNNQMLSTLENEAHKIVMKPHNHGSGLKSSGVGKAKQ